MKSVVSIYLMEKADIFVLKDLLLVEGTQGDPWLSQEVNLMILLLSLDFQVGIGTSVARKEQISLAKLQMNSPGSRLIWGRCSLKFSRKYLNGYCK